MRFENTFFKRIHSQNLISSFQKKCFPTDSFKIKNLILVNFEKINPKSFKRSLLFLKFWIILKKESVKTFIVIDLTKK